MKDDFDGLLDELLKQVQTTKEKDIAFQIIQIYNEAFKTYDEYINHIRNTILEIRNVNQKIEKRIKKHYVEPVILSEEVFNYILELRDENDHNTRCTKTN